MLHAALPLAFNHVDVITSRKTMLLYFSFACQFSFNIFFDSLLLASLVCHCHLPVVLNYRNALRLVYTILYVYMYFKIFHNAAIIENEGT